MRSPIIINNEETNFYIYDDGRVFNKKTNTFLKGKINYGYRVYDIRYNHKKYNFKAHRLVALAFIPNPNNLPVVHHKDNNRLNNKIENLEWVSYSDNNRFRQKPKQSKVQDVRNKSYKDEKWLEYEDTNYMISNYGRCLNTITNKILKGKKTDEGYIEYCIKVKGKKKTISAHRVEYSLFHNIALNRENIVNHIDGKRDNNYIDNLELTSYSGNVLHSYYITKNNKLSTLYQYSEEGDLIRTWTSAAEAARYYGVKSQSINQAVIKGNKSCGFYWKR